LGLRRGRCGGVAWGCTRRGGRLVPVAIPVTVTIAAACAALAAVTIRTVAAFATFAALTALTAFTAFTVFACALAALANIFGGLSLGLNFRLATQQPFQPTKETAAALRLGSSLN